MRHLSYLAVLLACLVCVAPLAVVVRRTVFAAPLRLGLTLLVPFVVFTGWDLYAIHQRQWHYAPSTTTGLLLPGRLPIEEALFFVVVPMCMILTFETVSRVLRRRGPPLDSEGDVRDDGPGPS